MRRSNTSRIPRSLSSSSSSAPRRRLPGLARLLLAVVLAGDRPAPVSADLLTLVVTAANAPEGALDRAEADAATFLHMFAALEGSEYTAVAPGQVASLDDVNVNIGGETEDYEVEGEIDTEGDADRRTLRQLRGGFQDLENRATDIGADSLPPIGGSPRRLAIDCPNACSNSGSNMCRTLGCAFCGKCRRLLQSLSRNKHRKIEGQLSGDLTAAYCLDAPGCALRAVIKRVHGDGTMTLAV